MTTTPPFAPLVTRIGAQEDGAGPEAWAIHSRAVAEQRAGRRIAGKDVIVLSVGDPDFRTPDAVAAAAMAALNAGDTHYTPVVGTDALRAAIAHRMSVSAGVEWSAEEIAVVSGAQCALFCAALCLAGPGDEIVALDPMYVTYPATVQAGGATLRRAATSPELGFRPTRAAIEAQITERTRAIMYATPNNPSGVMLTEEEIAMIAEIAQAHNLWVISDEVYAEIGFDRPHRMIAALDGMRARTVTIGSLSKSHAMTGWRIGWAAAPRALIDHFDNLALCMLYGSPGFTQAGAVAALSDGPDGAWGAAADMRETYRRRRDLAIEALGRIPGLVCDAPEGGMFALVDIRGTGIAPATFCERLFEEQGVSVIEGRPFGPSAAGFVRISFAVSEATLREGCERIEAFVSATRG